MAFVTRCPHCGAVWRLPDRKTAEAGPVKCSACLRSFDASRDLLEVPDSVLDVTPRVTLHRPPAEPVASSEPPKAETVHLSALSDEPIDMNAMPHIVPGEIKQDSNAPTPNPERLIEPKSGSGWFTTFLCGVLLLVIAAIALLLFNQQVLSVVPQAQPLYSKVCALVPCTGYFERDINAFVVSKTQLNKLDADGHYLVDLNVINGSTRAQGVPHLAIDFMDANNVSVHRHTLTPADYLANAAQIKSLPPEQQLPIRFTIHTNTNPTRYVVSPFYP